MSFKNICKLRKRLIIFFYKYFCKFYQKITTIYENLFMKKHNANFSFAQKGFFIMPFEKRNYLNCINKSKIFLANDYLNVTIPDPDQIKLLIGNIFTKDLRDNITKITGFNFSIDFLIIYERKFIPNEFRDVDTLNQAYSYKWHFDKPNSSNMLKIFIPINITNRHGPLQLLDKKQSKKIKGFANINQINNKINFEGNSDKIFGFNPTLCAHRDGIPDKNLSATQIMFQLNPHSKWVVNSRLYNDKYKMRNQFGIWTNEPKFPLFAYFFDKRLDF